MKEVCFSGKTAEEEPMTSAYVPDVGPRMVSDKDYHKMRISFLILDIIIFQLLATWSHSAS